MIFRRRREKKNHDIRRFAISELEIALCYGGMAQVQVPNLGPRFPKLKDPDRQTLVSWIGS